MMRLIFCIFSLLAVINPTVSKPTPSTSQIPVSTPPPTLTGSAELRTLPIGCEKSATAYAGVRRDAQDGNYELPVKFKIVGDCRFPQLAVRYYGIDTNSGDETILINLVKTNGEKIAVTVCHYEYSSSNMPRGSVATNISTETDECPVYAPLSEYIRYPREISFVASVQERTNLDLYGNDGFEYDGVLYGVFIEFTVTCPKKPPPRSTWRFDERAIISPRRKSVTITNGVPWDDAELTQPFKFYVIRRYECVDPQLSVDFVELDHNTNTTYRQEVLTISVSGQRIAQCQSEQCAKTWKSCFSNYKLSHTPGYRTSAVTVMVHRPNDVNFCEDYQRELNGQNVTFYTWLSVKLSCAQVKRRPRRRFDGLMNGLNDKGRYFAVESSNDGEDAWVTRQWKLFAGVLVIGLVLILGAGYVASGGLLFPKKKNAGEYSPLLPDVAVEANVQQV